MATALHFKALAEGKVSFYTCPIKALVNEKFFALCEAFGPENVGMMTGDASINRDAPIICCTAEILANMACARPSRAWTTSSWTSSTTTPTGSAAWPGRSRCSACRATTFLLMSATLGDMSAIAESLAALTGREVAVVRSGERPVPLDFEYRETPLHETIEDLFDKGLHPIYLVNFTQRAAAEQAQDLMSVNFSTKDDKEAIRGALEDTPFDSALRQGAASASCARHRRAPRGAAAALPAPGREAGAAGPAQGRQRHRHAGRGREHPHPHGAVHAAVQVRRREDWRSCACATSSRSRGARGGRGFDTRGAVVAQAPEHVVENLRLDDKRAAGKKVVRRQPPTKGYVHWDKTTFERLLTKPPEPLESRFEVTHGLLLNLLQAEVPHRGGGYGRLVDLIARSHVHDRARAGLRRTAARAFRTLRGAGLIALVGARPARVEVSPGCSSTSR